MMKAYNSAQYGSHLLGTTVLNTWSDARLPFVSTDFLDASHRHYTDAGLLDRHERYANADHLYGIAAECMLKTIMIGLGAQVSNKGNLREQAYKVHIDTLWLEFSAFVGGAGGSNYMPFPPHQTPFLDWDINQRYAAERHFTDRWIRSKRRREDVQAIARTLQAAILDGLVSE